MEKTEAKKKEPPFELEYRDWRPEYLYSLGELSPFFREIVDNARLMASKCPKCGKVWMYPRGDCPDCYEENEWIPITGEDYHLFLCLLHRPRDRSPEVSGAPVCLCPHPFRRNRHAHTSLHQTSQPENGGSTHRNESEGGLQREPEGNDRRLLFRADWVAIRQGR
jgi:hypothetical protein